MKKQIGLFTAILFAVSTLMMACKAEVHTHTFAEEWSSDETDHWHASTCGHEVTEGKTAHTFGDWTITKAATCTDEGIKTGVCKVCKKEVTEKIDAKGHSYGEYVSNNDATTEKDGTKTRTCEVCGNKETVVDEGSKLENVAKAPEGFVLVEAGTFQMGSNDGSDSNKPVHQVTITKDFYMGKYEVTQAEYEKYCSYESISPSSSYGDGDNYPVYYVSWYDALVYCNKRSMAEGLTPCYSISGNTDPGKWGAVPTSTDSTGNPVECNWNANGYRLPTEAEWEYAARAGDDTVESLTYSGTSDVNELEEYAWYNDNSNSTTHEVGKKEANAFGLYDMSGNVSEWCWNWFTDSYDTTTEGGSDPTGTSAGALRVSRGGGWYYGSDGCAVSYRSYNRPVNCYFGLGFRVVRLSN